MPTNRELLPLPAHRGLAVIAVVTVLVACGPAAPGGTGGPAATGPGGTSSAGTSPGPSAASGLTSGALAAAKLTSVSDVAAFENEQAAAVAAAAGIPEHLGAGTWTWVEEQLRGELAKALAEAGVTSAGPILLASVDTAPLPFDVDSLANAGVVGLALAAAFTMFSTPSNSSGANIDLDSTQSQTANGETSTARVATTIQFGSSGSQLSADVSLSVDVTVTNATSGAVLRTARFLSRGTIKLDLCPDSSGKARGHVSMRVEGGTSADGAGVVEVESDVEVTVGDDAWIQSVTGDGTSTQTTAGPGRGPRRSVVTAGFTAPVSRAGIIDAGRGSERGRILEESGEPLTEAEATAAARQVGSTMGVATYVVATRAQDHWRGGNCVEIRATEQTRKVKKNETVQFEARVWHKVEGVELTKPIHSAFAGTASLDPVDVEVPSPMLLSFKAGPNLDDQGTVSLTTTSNRGIGTLDITFTVAGGWFIDGANFGGRLKGLKCGDPPGDWVIDGTYKVGAFAGEQRWTITIGADERTGTFGYNTTQTGTIQGVTIYVVGLAFGEATLDIDPVTGQAHMELEEKTHTYSATTSKGGSGRDQDADLVRYAFDWEVGGDCP
ncbi:MAG TPA: hypothetical protein VNL94_08175 [Candidatus Binatia bacterium]|nr:hypothetical protein [Candidatus Binatia bacterium]